MAVVEEGVPHHYVDALAGQQAQRVQPPGDGGSRVRPLWGALLGCSGTAVLQVWYCSCATDLVLAHSA